MLIGYKYRLYPNVTQSKYLDSCLAAARITWNLMHEVYELHYRAYKKGLDKNEAKRQITVLRNEFEWMQCLPARAFEYISENYYEAWQRFFKSSFGRPRFKKKDGHQSFQSDRTISIDWEGGKVKILKQSIKINIDRLPIERKTRTITVSKTPTGKYYISVLIDENEAIFNSEKTNCNNKAVGVDLNIAGFHTSDGDIYETPRPFKENKKKLARLQKQLARKKKGSNRSKKQKLKIAKVHERIANVRSNFLHNTSDAILRGNDIVCIEDLNNAGMGRKCKPKKSENGPGFEPNGQSRKAGLNRSLKDAGFGEFRRQLTYKAKFRDKSILLAPRFAPTSKTCSSCGHKADKMPLKIRKWDCPECGASHDRDINAAKNILKEGLK